MVDMDFLTYLDRREKELVRFTQTLVRINSVNGNELEVARLIQNKLRKHGIMSGLLGKGDRKNLIAEIGKGRKCLILNGHLDTVPLGDPKKWRFPPLSARIHKGRIYGRGSYDMKGGLASLVFALIALKESGVKLNGKIKLVLTWGEETGHLGLKELLRKGCIKADAAIVAEPMPPSKGIRIGARGVLRLELETKGKSAHSGSLSQKGINAVTNMAKLLLELEKLKPRYKKHKLFPPPRISPGTVIEAGEAVNIIPDRCKAQVDCRLSYGQTDKTLLQDIMKLINRIKQKDKDFRVRIRKTCYTPPTIIDERESIVRISRNAIKEILMVNPLLEVSGGVTDGALMVMKGIPAVVFGPFGAKAHSENEYVEVRSLLKAAKAHALAAREFLKE